MSCLTKLSVSTAFIKEFNVLDSRLAALAAHMSAMASTYSWVAPANHYLDGAEASDRSTISFRASVRVWPGTAVWLPAFFAKMALMQPIDAERTASSVAEMLQASPDTQPVRAALGKTSVDDILFVGEHFFKPDGLTPSRWAQVEEFQSIADNYGRNDQCFGFGDEGGLTLETPFGSDSALIRLLSDVPHPALGNGLLTSIQLPFTYDEDEATRIASELNLRASALGATNATLLGSWHPREIRGAWAPAYGSFIPNALYNRGLATNMALWAVDLAQWARAEVWPQLTNEKMITILNRRRIHSVR